MQLATVLRPWWRHHDRARDAAPGVVLVVVSMLAGLFARSGSGSHQADVVWMAVSCVPLAFRSRWPLQVLLITFAVDLARMAIDPHIRLSPAASLVALYTFATRSGRRTAWAVGLAATGAITTAYALTHSPPFLSGGLLAVFNLAMIATALGDSMRSRRAYIAEVEARAEHAEHTREQEASRRVADERIRIARDLHDVVAHHIALVNAQAGVAHHLLHTDPEVAFQALANIKENSRAALDELRATVVLLRQPGDTPEPRHPLPGLADLDGLIDSFRAIGLPVSLTRTGTPEPAASSTELAAYRIVQEALTNAHKHALATRVCVDLRHGRQTLRISVTDDGRPGVPRGAGSGNGLIGMQERASAVGGTVVAGPRAEGGFRVSAELPLTSNLKGSL